MLGPWHLSGIFDGAIDRRPRAYRRRSARPPRPDRPAVDVWTARVATGPHVLWPPVHVDDQAEHARRVVAARVADGALVTVLARRRATALVTVDVFGEPLTALQQRRVRGIFEVLAPRPFFRIRPWLAIDVGPFGGFTTAARVRDDDGGRTWPPVDVLDPALAELERVLATPTRGRWAA
jgi:hypothetical protein